MIYMLQLEGVFEELLWVNMLYGYFGLCIQCYNIYIYICIRIIIHVNLMSTLSSPKVGLAFKITIGPKVNNNI
jgi:hypothetical protein